ncbi:hypothetical protein [Eubacterium barkeri]|uniref:Uncharacterized protein n=1 Tax=Eubacterium barkeri TaxID=1528 RepID=A0A1H3J0G7_EUBBA|nr:hypothetical protein [Eubacterium barkeri]SDY33503.1 hypothetical protein SAMN04488579_12631 [Eubacterium barkeri]
MKTAADFAQELDGREYKHEMTDAEIAEAAQSQVVVVFGHSDDTTVFHGAVEAQVNTIDGAEIYLTPQGIFEDCACNCVHAQAAKAKAQIIKAIWCKGPYVWHYETAIPHYHFDIIDNQPADNLKFCQGIVFQLEDLNSIK